MDYYVFGTLVSITLLGERGVLWMLTPERKKECLDLVKEYGSS